MTCEFPRLTRIVNGEVRHLSAGALVRDQSARLPAAQVLHDVLERGTNTALFLAPDEPAFRVLIWGLAVALPGWYPYAPQVQAETLSDSYAAMALRAVGAGSW